VRVSKHGDAPSFETRSLRERSQDEAEGVGRAPVLLCGLLVGALADERLQVVRIVAEARCSEKSCMALVARSRSC